MHKDKQKKFSVIDYIFRSLTEHKLRTYLTVSGIAVCIALFILFNSLGEGLNDYISGRTSSEHLERYEEMSELLDGWLNVLTSVFVIILVVAVANSMLISISERQRELGTLKAIGITSGQVRKLVFFEAWAITGLAFLIGTLLGIALALGCDQLFTSAGSGGEGLGWFFAPAKITFRTIISAAFISIVAGTLAALYPALRAASLKPAEALRYE
ncbi:MAG: FtsX-like permease family protein [Thermoplasmata archaeon]|nr:MAG: FtsX-like permease family protein [Thermoplasmata archaeon]